jgi:hypothetical protein
MDIQEVSYYVLECYSDGYWINRMMEAASRCHEIETIAKWLGVRNLEEYLFTSPGFAERFLKEKFIPVLEDICEYPLCHYPTGPEYRRDPSGKIDVRVSDDGVITISRHFQVRPVIVNKVKKVVVVNGEEYVREVEEKTYGEWTEVKPEVEVKFCRYRKVMKVVGI